MKFDSNTFVLSGSDPVDEKRCVLNSLAVYTGGFLCLDGNRWKIKALVKAQSEVDTSRM